MKNVYPLCNGEKGWDELIILEWDDPARYKRVVCWECQGKGEISDIAAAIYKAKHMAVPNRLIRFE